jgi:riboflavin synthase
MFTGIIETTGTIQSVEQHGTNLSYWVNSTLANDLKVDQSLSHNGVCLTIEAIKNDLHRVTAIEETLQKTNLGALSVGSIVNLERCMQLNGRLDGHIVQGHVDCTAVCTEAITKEGSWEYRFEIPTAFASLIIEKGSITINGTSLTIFDISDSSFKVAIIPYTYHHTNISAVREGTVVNIEFDMIGKYVNRIASLQK